MTVDELLAQAEIRQTMINYNMAGDTQRKDDAAAQFLEDGVLRFANIVARGRGEIAASLKSNAQSAGAARVVRHNLMTSDISLDGDEATGRTYFFVVTDSGPSHQGIYLDRFRKVNGCWLISEREVRLDWQAQ